MTSKVLNEGVNVPEDCIGIIVSYRASIRKYALLYALVSQGTSDFSERRCEHRVYK